MDDEDHDGQHGGSGTRRIALIEVEGRDGRVARTVDVRRWPLTIGRAIDNDLVVDDPHVAAHHLRIEAGPGAVGPDAPPPAVVVLDTRNGVRLGGERLAAGRSAVLPPAGATLVVGTTALRVRLPGEVLAIERPLVHAPGSTVAQLAAMALVLAVVLGLSQWVMLDPGADTSAWLPVAVGLPLTLAAWCGGWALMSKLFQHRFDFVGHLRAALPWLLAWVLAEALWPQLSAALGQRWMWEMGPPVQAVLLALLLRAHLRLLLPAHPRAVTAAAALLLVAGGGISLAAIHRATDSFSPTPYMSTLPLPALRWAGTVPAARLADDIQPLAGRLEQRVRQARRDEASGDDNDDGD